MTIGVAAGILMAAVIMRLITDRAAAGTAVLIASHDRALLKAAGATTHEMKGNTDHHLKRQVVGFPGMPLPKGTSVRQDR